MYSNTEINWSKQTSKKERITYTQIPFTEKLPDGIFICPHCYGSGKVTEIYKDPGPNKMGKCHICDGTGEIIKCIHPDCNSSVPNNPQLYPTKLCRKHEEERMDIIYKKAIEMLEFKKQKETV